jgi:uncharacterized membrane protein
VISNKQTTVTVSLILYTIIGLVMYFYSFANNLRVTRRYGVIILVLIVLRLMFIDIYTMDIIQRIITFILIGVLLISTAFITKNPKLIGKLKETS